MDPLAGGLSVRDALVEQAQAILNEVASAYPDTANGGESEAELSPNVLAWGVFRVAPPGTCPPTGKNVSPPFGAGLSATPTTWRLPSPIAVPIPGESSVVQGPQRRLRRQRH